MLLPSHLHHLFFPHKIDFSSSLTVMHTPFPFTCHKFYLSSRFFLYHSIFFTLFYNILPPYLYLSLAISLFPVFFVFSSPYPIHPFLSVLFSCLLFLFCSASSSSSVFLPFLLHFSFLKYPLFAPTLTVPFTSPFLSLFPPSIPSHCRLFFPPCPSPLHLSSFSPSALPSPKGSKWLWKHVRLLLTQEFVLSSYPQHCEVYNSLNIIRERLIINQTSWRCWRLSLIISLPLFFLSLFISFVIFRTSKKKRPLTLPLDVVEV